MSSEVMEGVLSLNAMLCSPFQILEARNCVKCSSEEFISVYETAEVRAFVHYHFS